MNSIFDLCELVTIESAVSNTTTSEDFVGLLSNIAFYYGVPAFNFTHGTIDKQGYKSAVSVQFMGYDREFVFVGSPKDCFAFDNTLTSFPQHETDVEEIIGIIRGEIPNDYEVDFDFE